MTHEEHRLYMAELKRQRDQLRELKLVIAGCVLVFCVSVLWRAFA